MLEIENLTVRFGGLVATKSVSFKMASTDILGLVGPNGAGKTTLFNAISGLVRPREGAIRFNGTDIIRLPLHMRARKGLGRTFQIPQPMPELTVRENLIVAQVFGAGKRDDARIDEILDIMELSKKAEHEAAGQLALQELKRLEVAKALAINPKLILLDEVLAGLESQAKRFFMKKLQELHVQYKIGIIMVEHDIETISNLCSSAIVLNFGEVIANGTPQDVFRNPQVIESYTGVAHA
jgi:branched-chain amino acid transport system ATP-binding protein